MKNYPLEVETPLELALPSIIGSILDETVETLDLVDPNTEAETYVGQCVANALRRMVSFDEVRKVFVLRSRQD